MSGPEIASLRPCSTFCVLVWHILKMSWGFVGTCEDVVKISTMLWGFVRISVEFQRICGDVDYLICCFEKLTFCLFVFRILVWMRCCCCLRRSFETGGGMFHFMRFVLGNAEDVVGIRKDFWGCSFSHHSTNPQEVQTNADESRRHPQKSQRVSPTCPHVLKNSSDIHTNYDLCVRHPHKSPQMQPTSQRHSHESPRPKRK